MNYRAANLLLSAVIFNYFFVKLIEGINYCNSILLLGNKLQFNPFSFAYFVIKYACRTFIQNKSYESCFRKHVG